MKVFEECDRKWRGIGIIPLSGWRLRPEFDAFNAEIRFDVQRHPAPGIARVHCRTDPAGTQEAA